MNICSLNCVKSIKLISHFIVYLWLTKPLFSHRHIVDISNAYMHSDKKKEKNHQSNCSFYCHTFFGFCSVLCYLFIRYSSFHFYLVWKFRQTFILSVLFFQFYLFHFFVEMEYFMIQVNARYKSQLIAIQMTVNNTNNHSFENYATTKKKKKIKNNNNNNNKSNNNN